MNEEKRDEVGALKEVLDILDAVEDKAIIRNILTWACGKYLQQDLSALSPAASGGRSSDHRPAKRSSKGSKKVPLTIEKSLDLRPADNKTLESFVDERKPTNVVEKVVVCTYYLKTQLGIDQVNANHIFTCFKSMGWRVPSDLPNTLHQAGSRGWLDTSDREDIVVTIIGQNMVEHDLPKT